jgi:hypothetical protein
MTSTLMSPFSRDCAAGFQQLAGKAQRHQEQPRIAWDKTRARLPSPYTSLDAQRASIFSSLAPFQRGLLSPQDKLKEVSKWMKKMVRETLSEQAQAPEEPGVEGRRGRVQRATSASFCALRFP